MGEWPKDVIVGSIKRHIRALRGLSKEVADVEQVIADHERLLAELGETAE